MVNGQEGKRVFISYLNDDDRKNEGWFILISIENNLVTFKSGINIISIPSSRVLKIKEQNNE